MSKLDITGWALSLLATVLWLYGYLTAGNAPVFDWRSAPWWIAEFLPNAEAEIGMALIILGAILIYWPHSSKP